MNAKLSRRTVLALASSSALAGVGNRAAFAQTTAQTDAFPNGNSVTWIDPWTKATTTKVDALIPGAMSFTHDVAGDVLLGYYAAETDIEEGTMAITSSLGIDPAVIFQVEGGDDTVVGGGGAAVSSTSYRLYLIHLEGESLGFYVKLVDGLELSILVGPVTTFAEGLESAQTSITVNDTPVFDGLVGADLQASLESFQANQGKGGEYTDASGLVHVTWVAGWTVSEQNEHGVVISNPAGSMKLYVAGYPREGRTWAEQGQIDHQFYLEDQGDSPVDHGIMVTNTGFTFATNGQYGLRVVVGSPTTDPEIYVLTFAANIALDEADPVALLKQAQADVRINGVAPFARLDQFTDKISA